MTADPQLTQAEVDLTNHLIRCGWCFDEIINQVLSLRVADDKAEMLSAKDRVRERLDRLQR